MAVGVNAATFDVLVLGFMPAPFFFSSSSKFGPADSTSVLLGLVEFGFLLFFFKEMV